MSLNTIANPPKVMESARFFRVGYLPTYAALVFLLILVWAGAPGDNLSFDAAWRTGAELGVAEIFLISLSVIVLASVLHPLQLSLVRMFEGGWPTWLGAGLLRRRQLRRMEKLEKKAMPPQPPAAPDEEKIRKAGVAGSELRKRFPLDEHLVRPTALGNALAAMEDSAGRTYGMDAVVAWPRLYAVLGDSVKSIVDDRRDTMDGAARMAVSASVVTIASIILLWGVADWWWLLALIPALVAVASYRGAVQAAIAYGEAVHVAFDMHRFDLLAALKVESPAKRADESTTNHQLCDLWRQGVPPTLSYVSGKEEQ